MSTIFDSLGKFLSGSNPVAALVDATIGKAVDKALNFIPDPVQKAQFQKDMETLRASEEAKQLDSDVAQLASVNATMQAELANSKDENWLQKSWRPLCGFTVALGSLFCTISGAGAFIYGIVYKVPEAISAIPSMVTAEALLLSIPGAAVGIIAWHGGMLQRESATADTSK